MQRSLFVLPLSSSLCLSEGACCCGEKQGENCWSDEAGKDEILLQLSWNNVRSFLFLTMIISRGFFNEGGSIVKLVLVIHLRCTVDLCIYVVGEFLAVCGKDDRKMSPRNFIDYFWNLKSFEIFKFVLLFNFFFPADIEIHFTS